MSSSGFRGSLTSALETLSAHLLRTLLTLLSIIAGTATIIALGAIISGYDKAVSDMYRGFGPTMVVAYKYKLSSVSVSREEYKRKPLTLEQSRAVAASCESCRQISTVLLNNNINKTFSGHFKGTEVVGLVVNGVDEAYQASGSVLRYGRFISEVDNLHRLPVCILGEDLHSAWFPNTEGIGQRVEIDGHQLEVIGVVGRPASNLPGLEDRRVLVPYSTMKKMFPTVRENLFMIFAQDTQSMPEATDQILTILRTVRRVGPSKPDDFALTTAEEIMRLPGTPLKVSDPRNS